MFQNISENFSQIFRAFGVFFPAKIIILDFSRIILFIKLINSENNNRFTLSQRNHDSKAKCFFTNGL